MVAALTRPPRTQVRRLPEKAVTDVAILHAVLDAGSIAHVGIATEEGQPYVLPCAYARDGDRVLLHGSTASRLFRRLAAGAPCGVTVTLLDGLVAARSVFESSMHYRSAMVLGTGAAVPAQDRENALRLLSEHLMPGRWGDARPPSARELAQTLVVAVPLDEWSVKVSDGPPEDDEADLDRPVWAGVIPYRTVAGQPVAAPGLDPTRELPGYVSSWSVG